VLVKPYCLFRNLVSSLFGSAIKSLYETFEHVLVVHKGRIKVSGTQEPLKSSLHQSYTRGLSAAHEKIRRWGFTQTDAGASSRRVSCAPVILDGDKAKSPGDMTQLSLKQGAERGWVGIPGCTHLFQLPRRPGQHHHKVRCCPTGLLILQVHPRSGGTRTS